MPRRIAAWVVLALCSVLTVYGIFSNKLFAQELWYPDGRTRLLIFAAGATIWTTLLRFFRTEVYVAATAALALVYSLLVAGPLAVMAVLFILFACWLLGGGRDLVDLSLGLALLVLVVGFAVHVRINTPWLYATALAGVVVVALLRRRPSWRSFAGIGTGARGWDRLFIELLGFGLFVHLLVALQPEVGADGLGTHLNVAASVARHGLWDFNFKRVVWAVMPMGGDWLWTVGYVLGGEMAARLMNFACLAALAGVVAATAETPIAAALFVSSPIVHLLTGSLFVENVWTLLVVSGLVAIVRGRVWTAAILLGTAISCKFGALAFVVPALVILATRLPRRAPAAVALAALCALPPYVNAWVKTGNPFFPFFNATFKTPYYEQNINFRDVKWSQPLRAETLYDVTFHTSNFNEGLDGGFTFHLFLLLPFAALLLKRASPAVMWIALLVSVIGFLIVFSSTPYLRYVYPAVPLLSMVIAPAIASATAARVVAFAVIGLNIWFFAASGWYHRHFHASSVFEPGAVEIYVRRSAAPRLMVDYLNKHAPGEPAMFIRTNQSAGLAGTAYSDEWYHYSFTRGIANAEIPFDCLRVTSAHGIRWFVVPTIESGIDPQYPMLQPFLERYTRGVHHEGPYQLRRLLPEYEGDEGLRRAEAAATGLLIAGAGAYDDFHEAVYFQGAWQRDHQFREPANRSLTYSATPGDFARLVFRGTSVRYVYTMAFNRGTAQIEIDGVEQVRMDLYSKTVRWRQSRTFAGLAPGEHTLTIRVLPERNRASTGGFVDIDQLVVE